MSYTILAISGSPRNRSNSEILIDHALKPFFYIVKLIETIIMYRFMKGKVLRQYLLAKKDKTAY